MQSCRSLLSAELVWVLGDFGEKGGEDLPVLRPLRLCGLPSLSAPSRTHPLGSRELQGK